MNTSFFPVCVRYSIIILCFAVIPVLEVLPDVAWAIVPGTSPKAEASDPNSKPETEFQKRARERLRRTASGQDFAQPFEATKANAQESSVPVSRVTRRKAGLRSDGPVSEVTKRKSGIVEETPQAPSDPKEADAATSSASPPGQTTEAAPPVILETPKPASASDSSQASTEETRASVPDRMCELHLMRKVFDRAYDGPYEDLGYPAKVAVAWPDWEEVYFERERYRKALEDEVAKDWPVGHLWWHVTVTVACRSELERGGPVYFTVQYPWVEFRDDLQYVVTKDAADQQTHVSVASDTQYYTPRYSYQTAMFLMILIWVLVLAGIAVLGWGSWLAANTGVNILSEILSPHDPSNIWVRRVSWFLLGAAGCLALSIIMFLF